MMRKGRLLVLLSAAALPIGLGAMLRDGGSQATATDPPAVTHRATDSDDPLIAGLRYWRPKTQYRNAYGTGTYRGVQMVSGPLRPPNVKLYRLDAAPTRLYRWDVGRQPRVSVHPISARGLRLIR